MTLSSTARSHVGTSRSVNQDRWYVGARLFVVADGVGGHQAGEVAAQRMVDALAPLDDAAPTDPAAAQAALRQAIEQANASIHAEASGDPDREGMATTCTAALVVGDQLVLAQVGDTAAYRVNAPDGLQRLTPDHSFVGSLVEAGYITEAEAREHPRRSLILRAVGTQPQLEVDLPAPVTLATGERLLLATDGVTGVLEDAELAGLVHSASLEEAADAVVATILERGAPDNLTLVLVEVT